MYNRYLNHPSFTAMPEQPEFSPPESTRARAQEPSGGQESAAASPLLGEVTGGVSRLLGGILKNFSLDNLDTGDILLVLIILFLYLEGDNLELVITLGLMLLLGLGDG